MTELAFHRRHLGAAGFCPVAADLEQRTMALPLHNRMDSANYEYVVEQLRHLTT